MSEFTKLVKSDAGLLKVNFLHCDNCAEQVQMGGEIAWITTSSNMMTIGNLPMTGDFCSRACVVAYYSWMPGEPWPVGVIEAQKLKIESMPRHEIRDHGCTIIRTNADELAMRFLEGE